MVDHIDPIIKKNLVSTEWLYGVDPTYFDGMDFYKAIEERARLAKENSKFLYERQEHCFGTEIGTENYIKLEHWLKDVYKAIEFNEKLLEERKRYKKLLNFQKKISKKL